MKILRLVIGALGGLSATGPMTILMERLHRVLPAAERYPLPPREITSRLAEKARLPPVLHREVGGAMALLNHFAYGSAAGILYALCAGQGRHGMIKGPAFGLALWMVSYLGLLPATSLLRHAGQHPSRRNALMMAAHLLWGAVLGLFVETLLEDRRSDTGALVQSSPVPSRDT